MIHRPVAPVEFWSARAGAWVTIIMLVDTGADYTLLGRAHAAVLGVDLRRHCRRVTTAGIGGTEAVHLMPRVSMSLGSRSRVIPVGFLDRDDVPPLLGRLLCLDTFKVCFAARQTTFSARRQR